MQQAKEVTAASRFVIEFNGSKITITFFVAGQHGRTELDLSPDLEKIARLIDVASAAGPGVRLADYKDSVGLHYNTQVHHFNRQLKAQNCPVRVLLPGAKGRGRGGRYRFGVPDAP